MSGTKKDQDELMALKAQTEKARQEMNDAFLSARPGVTYEELKELREGNEPLKKLHGKIMKMEEKADVDRKAIMHAKENLRDMEEKAGVEPMTIMHARKKLRAMEDELLERDKRQREKERWESYPVLSLNEAACLLLGIPPETYPSNLKDVTMPGTVFNCEVIEPVQEMKRKLVRATQAGELKTTTKEPFKDRDCLLFSSVPEEKKLYSAEVRSWYRRVSGEKEPGEQVTISVPGGTTWHEVTIRIVNDERIEIRHPGGMAPWTKKDLGFGKKSKLWELLDYFSKHKGQLKGVYEIKKAKPNISNLRKHLKKLFPNVEGEPIGVYSRFEGWICNFNICNAEQQIGYYQ